MLTRVLGGLLLVSAIVTPSAATDRAGAALDAWLTTLYPASKPGAAVLVKREGEMILRKGYGRANLEWDVAITPRTVFRLASITKQFTAVAILMLVDDGLLSLDEPLSTYLPEINERATVEQLLTHTSGLTSLPAIAGFPVWSKLELTPREVVGLFENQERAFLPDTGWQYSDAGYIELGLLIEAVSGISYERFMQERIFKPLGMDSTYYDAGRNLIPMRANGYTESAGQIENAPFRSMSVPFASGALASTVDDLSVWDDALSSGRVVDEMLLARAFTPHRLADGTPTSYGYGWLVSTIGGETVLQHGGRINGFEAHVIRVPAQRIFIAVLTNVVGRDPAPDFVAQRILHQIDGTAEEPTASLRIEETRLYPGIYQFGEGAQYQVVLDAGRLLMRNQSGDEREFVPLGHDRFRFTTSYTRVTFERDAGGMVIGMSIETAYDPARHGKKVLP
jgi:CubicO group peptidase (beta-lactamase class C family)